MVGAVGESGGSTRRGQAESRALLEVSSLLGVSSSKYRSPGTVSSWSRI